MLGWKNKFLLLYVPIFGLTKIHDFTMCVCPVKDKINVETLLAIKAGDICRKFSHHVHTTGSISKCTIFYAHSYLRAPQKGHAIISTKILKMFIFEYPSTKLTL